MTVIYWLENLLMRDWESLAGAAAFMTNVAGALEQELQPRESQGHNHTEEKWMFPKKISRRSGLFVVSVSDLLNALTAGLHIDEVSLLCAVSWSCFFWITLSTFVVSGHCCLQIWFGQTLLGVLTSSLRSVLQKHDNKLSNHSQRTCNTTSQPQILLMMPEMSS